MEKLISELDLTRNVREALHRAGIEYVSELNNREITSISSEKYIPSDIRLNILDELIRKGYVPIPDGEVLVSGAGLSTRVMNILHRNCILYLSQLTELSSERIQRFRGLGRQGYKELLDTCRKYEIQIVSNGKYRDFAVELGLSTSYAEFFFDRKIDSLDYFNHISTDDLYSMCNHLYNTTMKLYYFLIRKDVVIEKGSHTFVFEILSHSQARLARRKGYYLAADFTDHSEMDLIQIGLSRQSAKKILNYLQEIE